MAKKSLKELYALKERLERKGRTQGVWYNNVIQAIWRKLGYA